MKALDTRLTKLEATELPPRFEVVSRYEDETNEEAWRAERGDEPKPSGPRDLVVFISKFTDTRPPL